MDTARRLEGRHGDGDADQAFDGGCFRHWGFAATVLSGGFAMFDSVCRNDRPFAFRMVEFLDSPKLRPRRRRSLPDEASVPPDTQATGSRRSLLRSSGTQ